MANFNIPYKTEREGQMEFFDNYGIPYILDFIYQYKGIIKYVIFKNNYCVRVLKVDSIPTIIDSTDWSKLYVYSVSGIVKRSVCCISLMDC